MTGDRVTVVVMTRDRWPQLRRTLGRTLDRHQGPTIVVDNGSHDGTPDLVSREFADVDLVRLGRNLGAPARNVGVARARTPYVAFADDDSWWEPGALERAADLLDRHPRLAVVAARVVVGQEGRTDPVSRAMALSSLPRPHDPPGPEALGFLACGAVVRRTAFQEVGGFDDVVFFLGEEERVALDLAVHGWGLAYVAEVVAHHEPAPGDERSGRAALGVRNQLLTAVMRRPWPVVLTRVLAAATTSSGRRGILRALPATRAALRHRAPVPAVVERRCRQLA